MERELVLKNEILRGVVGSTMLGTSIEGQDDRDEIGICIEPQEYVCGLKKFEQYIYRDKPQGVRSAPGDLDLIIYSLRKYCYLAAKGNPSILVLMWLPEYMIKTEFGTRLIAIRDAFVSQEAGFRFLGYLRSQRMALKGERSKKVIRPELVEKYGYDTKFAMHAARLGLQGLQYVKYGTLTLPIPEPDLTTLLSIRKGYMSFEEVKEFIQEVEAELSNEVDKCEFRADMDRINRFLVWAHLSKWEIDNDI